MKIGFLYAGQGSQKEGMGADFYEKFSEVKKLYDENEDIKKLSFETDLEELSKTKNTQPCMLAFDVAVTDRLFEAGIEPDMVAGLSIGEYGALYAADVLSSEDVLKIARKRGQAMEEALVGKDTVMYAIIGGKAEELEPLAKKYSDEEKSVELANLNCPGQIVIGGDRERAEGFVAEAKEKKLLRKAVPLNVSGAFHTRYMKPAGAVLEELFKEIEFHEMKRPVVFNVTGKEKEAEEVISEMMVKQVQSAVRFEESIRYMLDKGVDTFVEIGFGGVLAGFVKKINPEAKVFPCYDLESFNAVVDELLD